MGFYYFVGKVRKNNISDELFAEMQAYAGIEGWL
jgi:hypothetical protein